MRASSASWLGLVLLACAATTTWGCGGGKTGPAELTRELTPWEVLGQKIGELEVTSLVTLRFGCSGCTRFVANELVVQPNGDFRIFDLTHRTERTRGTATPETLSTLRELLASAEWKALPEGATVGTQSPPWLELKAAGRRVRRLTPVQEGQEPALDRMLDVLDAVMSAGR